MKFRFHEAFPNPSNSVYASFLSNCFLVRWRNLPLWRMQWEAKYPSIDISHWAILLSVHLSGGPPKLHCHFPTYPCSILTHGQVIRKPNGRLSTSSYSSANCKHVSQGIYSGLSPSVFITNPSTVFLHHVCILNRTPPKRIP